MSGLIARARAIAHEAHEGQKDKSGRDYVTAHVADVARRVTTTGEYDPTAVAVAWLHDTIEDTPLTENDLRHMFPPPIVEAVAAITHYPHESRWDYYRRVKANPIALRVKLADIASNTDPARMALLDGKTRGRLSEKYATALEVLTR